MFCPAEWVCPSVSPEYHLKVTTNHHCCLSLFLLSNPPSLSLSLSRSSHFLYCHPHKVWRLKKIINFEEIFHQELERYKDDLSVTAEVCCLRAVLTFDALLSFSLHCLLLLDICFINLSTRRLSLIITVKSIKPFCTQLKEITSSSTHNFNQTFNNYKVDWHI